MHVLELQYTILDVDRLLLGPRISRPRRRMGCAGMRPNPSFGATWRRHTVACVGAGGST